MSLKRPVPRSEPSLPARPTLTSSRLLPPTQPRARSRVSPRHGGLGVPGVAAGVWWHRCEPRAPWVCPVRRPQPRGAPAPYGPPKRCWAPVPLPQPQGGEEGQPEAEGFPSSPPRAAFSQPAPKSSGNWEETPTPCQKFNRGLSADAAGPRREAGRLLRPCPWPSTLPGCLHVINCR